MGFPPLADSGNWHPATNSFELQLETYYSYQQTNFRYQLNGLPLSIICSGRPIEMDKPHILA
jgi:hypothetical protein